MKRKQTPAEFFFLHAGYSWDPAKQTKLQGRWECAHALARAEVWARGRLQYLWDQETNPDRSGIDHDGPMWCCIAYWEERMVGSLGGIDFGPDGVPCHPYSRVIQAELALDAMHD